MPTPKILLRSPNWVGDAVMATPVPRALRRAWPGSRIHVLARGWVAPVWEQHPDVERIVTLDVPGGKALGARWNLAFSLQREKYDLGLILPNSFSAAWQMLWAGPRQRVGYAAEGRNFCLTQAVPKALGPVPRPQTYLELVRAAGAQVDLSSGWEFTVNITDEERRQAEELLGPRPVQGRRIGLAPGSVALTRRWSYERYAELADRLKVAGHQVFLLGSKEDEPAATAVAEDMLHPAMNLVGRTSLRQALAVIRCLDLVVSNDSGAMHLAYSQGVPLVVLQGAADPRVTGPFGVTSRLVRALGVSCAPCVRNRCPRPSLECMDGIAVEEVWRVVMELLAQGWGPTP